MRKIARIIGVFAIEGIAFFLVVMGLLLVIGAIRGVDPREGGFLFVSPLAMLAIVLAMVSAVYGMLCGLAVNIFWNYVTRSTGNLLRLSAVVGAVFALLWTLMVYSSPPNNAEGFFRLYNLYTFLAVFAAASVSAAIGTAVGTRIFPTRVR